ncbi:hypothetical protein FGO68_gene4343 [Halteria grandinella]|uniref:RING-type domain-containing protein n=1 Tax=Halteria grandinella TaxID=5974 RepID=A0A8J8T0S4_HALGN|nr:hypothetical protein FGO68_gene4343 [Halteria grandinella]
MQIDYSHEVGIPELAVPVAPNSQPDIAKSQKRIMVAHKVNLVFSYCACIMMLIIGILILILDRQYNEPKTSEQLTTLLSVAVPFDQLGFQQPTTQLNSTSSSPSRSTSFAQPYFGLTLMILLINLFCIPLLMTFNHLAKSQYDQLAVVARLQLLFLMLQTMVSVFGMVFYFIPILNNRRSAHNRFTYTLVYMGVSEVLKLIESIMCLALICYAMRKPELSRTLKETITGPERLRQERINQQKLKEANEIIEKVPSANLCDEDVAKHLVENECVICLEILKKEKMENDIRYLSCEGKMRHYYHRDCLMAWFKTKAVCPICKNDKILETHLQINVVAELVNVTH